MPARRFANHAWNSPTGVVVLALLILCPLAAGQDESLWSAEGEQEIEQPLVTKAQIEALLEKWDQNQPQRARLFRQLREKDPIQFALTMHQIVQRQQAAEPPTPPGSRQAKDVAPQGSRQEAQEESREARAARWRQYLMDQLGEYMAWLEENAPQEAERLEALRDADPEEFVNQVAVSRRRYEPVIRAQKRNPELAEVLMADIDLQDQRDTLLAEIALAQGPQRDALVEQLAEVVSRRFDVIVQKRHIKFAEIEARIEKMRQSLQAQKNELQRLTRQKQRVTQDRVKELLQPPPRPPQAP